MRIGEFSKKNNITIETVRHYIDLGILIPYKKGGQYDFDESNQNDLDKILELKSLGFTLNEIKSILTYKLLGKFSFNYDNNILKNIFLLKEKEINRKIEELSIMGVKLKEKIESLREDEMKKGIDIGVEISNLNLLSCNLCKGDLYLEDGVIKNNKIIDGKLRCNCGNEYTIRTGILMVENNYKFTEEYKNENIIEEYLQETDEEYIFNIRKGLDWGSAKLKEIGYEDKVVLEIGSGLGFVLRNLYSSLSKNSVYIAIDNDINKHIYLKSLLGKSNLNNNILFICTDFKEIPIKEDIVDIFIDCSGSSNYWFEKNDFSINNIWGYLKKDAYLLLSYIIFKKMSLSNSIRNENRKNFNVNYVMEEIKKYELNIIDNKALNYLNRPSTYEDYFNENEEVYTYMVFAKR